MHLEKKDRIFKGGQSVQEQIKLIHQLFRISILFATALFYVLSHSKHYKNNSFSYNHNTKRNPFWIPFYILFYGWERKTIQLDITPFIWHI